MLIVDDEITLRRGISRLLHRLGATSAQAGDATAALAAVAETVFDAVLLDLGLPGGGAGIIEQLRDAARDEELAVIVLTGDDNDAVHARSLADGASDFLLKPVSAAVLAAHLGGAHKRAANVRRARARTSRLASYVSEQLLHDVQTAPVELTTTILFSDLRSFTSTSHGRAPAEIFEAINLVLRAQVGFVRSAGGYIDKFSGDGLLAVFDGDDGAANACAAGAAIVRWAAATTVPLGPWPVPPIGVGVHRGRVMRGDIGTLARREHTVIGHTVNLAARLCGVARALEVVISEAVLASAGPVWRSRERRDVALKGIDELTPVFVLDLREVEPSALDALIDCADAHPRPGGG